MTCPTCGACVIVGELRRGGHAFFAYFEEAVTSSAYLALPRRVTQLAQVFVASEFGSSRIHHCRDGAGGGRSSMWMASGEWPARASPRVRLEPGACRLIE